MPRIIAKLSGKRNKKDFITIFYSFLKACNISFHFREYVKVVQ